LIHHFGGGGMIVVAGVYGVSAALLNAVNLHSAYTTEETDLLLIPRHIYVKCLQPYQDAQESILVEKINTLRSSNNFFQSLPVSQLVEVAQFLKNKEFAVETVIRCCPPGKYLLYLVLSGEVAVYEKEPRTCGGSINTKGQSLQPQAGDILMILGCGTFLGYVPEVAINPRPTNPTTSSLTKQEATTATTIPWEAGLHLVARTEVRAYEMSANDFMKYACRTSAAYQNFARSYHRLLRSLSRRVKSLERCKLLRVPLSPRPATGVTYPNEWNYHPPSFRLKGDKRRRPSNFAKVTMLRSGNKTTKNEEVPTTTIAAVSAAAVASISVTSPQKEVRNMICSEPAKPSTDLYVEEIRAGSSITCSRGVITPPTSLLSSRLMPQFDGLLPPPQQQQQKSARHHIQTTDELLWSITRLLEREGIKKRTTASVWVPPKIAIPRRNNGRTGASFSGADQSRRASRKSGASPSLAQVRTPGNDEARMNNYGIGMF